MSEIKDVANTEFGELLEQVYLDQLDIVDSSRIDEQQNMSEELLAIVSAPPDDTLSMSGTAPRDGRCRELLSKVDLCQGPSPLSHLLYGCGDCVK